jgi:hypothetical protein
VLAVCPGFVSTPMIEPYIVPNLFEENPDNVVEESLKALGRKVWTTGTFLHKIVGLYAYYPIWMQNIVHKLIVKPNFKG